MEKKNKLVAVMSVFIILTIALVGMYSYYNFVIIPKYEVANNKETENFMDNTIEITKNIKIDSSKEIVYDAEYTYKDLDGKSYESKNMNMTFSLKDINVPYININSEDAKKANTEIKEIFDELAKSFEEELNNSKTWYNISKYDYFINEDILSIIITTESGGTAPEIYNYYTFNFNLNTLKLLNYQELYEYAGFTSDIINSKAEKEIKDCELLSNLTEEHVRGI